MNRPKIVVVGLNFGRHIVEEIAIGPASQYFELAGVCDLDATKTREIALKFGVPEWPSLETVLANPEIQAVALLIGPAGRAAVLQRIIEAGKDVMTTKPLETDPGAALAVLRRARELGRIIHLNSPSPILAPDLAKIQEWQRDLKLGIPIGARADVWCSYREEADGTWLDDEEKCPIAPLFRLGIYLINDLLRLFGPVRTVQVLQSRIFTGRPTPDNAQMGLEFKNGALANIFASFCVNDGDFHRSSLTLNFQDGTVYRDVGPQRAHPDSRISELSCVGVRQGRREVLAQAEIAKSSGAYDWANFARAMLGEKLEGEATPEQMVEGLHVIRAMSEAARTGATVKIQE